MKPKATAMGTHRLHGQQTFPEGDDGCLDIDYGLEDTAYAHAHFVLKLIAFWHEWAELKYFVLGRSVTYRPFVDYRNAACSARNRSRV